MTKPKKKKTIKVRKLELLLYVFGAPICAILVFLILGGFFKGVSNVIEKKQEMFLASDINNVSLFNEALEEVNLVPRGDLVKVNKDVELKDETGRVFYKVFINKNEYYVLNDNLVDDSSEVIREKKIYVRTPIDLLKDINTGQILTLATKGEELEVIGFDEVNEDGTVNYYKVNKDGSIGFIYSKYITFDYESSIKHYEPGKYYDIHSKRGNVYGGGSAGNLDYYPREKPVFTDNIMPEVVYALYLNGSKPVLDNVDNYIEFAKETNINAFVVDIKDNEAPRYKSLVMKEHSITNYNRASNTMDEYRKAIKKLKDNGFYVIGRITVFKDKLYVLDNPTHAIADKRVNTPLLHNKTYWPSPFQRDVWEFNVELAKEAVKEMGFNEIQFDYVRFPDRTIELEKKNIIDFKNRYNEDKAQAVQRFLMYACDQIHQLGAYVSADVFGESAHKYVTGYGQYWAAVSNVVDVISGMPYPDHFSKYSYGFKDPVWTVPYKLLNHWGSEYVMEHQRSVPTPAIVRTWIQAYDVMGHLDPFVAYNASQLEAQIRGLFDAGLNGGYMTWNSGSNLNKYKLQKGAFKINYR
ncbi:MAG: putative glycoside hydrolase [Bacilli bacterium]|nr:putative glycoside hydrolase [Bacilli bacterium]